MVETQKVGVAYSRAPITEAVIELRFADPVKDAAIERAVRRLSGPQYPHSDKEMSRELTLDFEKAAVAKSSVQWSGYNLSSADRTDHTLLRTSAFLGSRLAPYQGWEQFCSRVQGDWEKVRRDLGTPKIARVGVRFINRIDVPAQPNSQIDPSDYLRVGIAIPRLDLGPTSNYLLQVSRRFDDGNGVVTISSGTATSPVAGYQSLLLDIDVCREADIPANDAELWSLVRGFREKKNTIFESIVTDASRKLFQ